MFIRNNTTALQLIFYFKLLRANNYSTVYELELEAINMKLLLLLVSVAA